MERLRRALLFMPADDAKKVSKGAGSGADAVIMDLEDGVALNAKVAARAAAAEALRTLDFGRSERLIRLNACDTPQWRDDLLATVAARPDGYVLPKVQSATEVAQVDALLTQQEQAHGWPMGGIALIAIIETALGVANVREIAAQRQHSPRLAALAFGAEDLAGSMGARRTLDGWETYYGRAAVVVHAKAFGLQALDTPFLALADADLPRLTDDTHTALTMGYDGKLAIHPKHIAPICAVFTPTADEVTAARRIVEAHEAHQAGGAGVFALDGRMVDMPIVRAAERVLARARVAHGA
jgi:citrate lyase beta subunit